MGEASCLLRKSEAWACAPEFLGWVACQRACAVDGDGLPPGNFGRPSWSDDVLGNSVAHMNALLNVSHDVLSIFPRLDFALIKVGKYNNGERPKLKDTEISRTV